VTDEKKLSKTDPEDVFEKFFSDTRQANKSLELVSFQNFSDTADAVTATVSSLEGKVCKSLKSFLKKKIDSNSLVVADKALAVSLKESGVASKILCDSKTQEIFRGIRSYMDELLPVSSEDLKAMQLGLSHSLGRYKLKFSADKVDTMVIQAVGLLDELDKEINTYAMRVKEWYGWHFPELQGLVGDNVAYSKLVLHCGFRSSFHDKDLSSILEDESQQAAVKESAEISMGVEIADMDIVNIQSLAEQVLSMTEYRAQLFEYLKNRMNAIAPNLSILVGELVGARLISHAGSLMSLAKQPASTVQILGAEKALFRALKTKHDTPKYGLIYHASLIGQAAPKNKGKISRVLAAKAALAIRVDALSDDTQELDTTIGFEGRAKVEARLRQLEGGSVVKASAANGGGGAAQNTTRYDAVAARSASAARAYNDASDMVLDGGDGPRRKLPPADHPHSDDVKNNDDDDASRKKKKAKKEEKKKKKEKEKSKKRKSEAVEGGGNGMGGTHDDDDAADDEEDRAARKAAKKEKKKDK
jgi:nucleolar protein 58